MKILYAIQGTGNGHVSRAKEIIPHLKNYGELDILISGTQVDINLDYPVKYQSTGIGFVFGKSGGVDYWKTFKGLHAKTFLKEVLDFPLHHYDLIINDFEPITAWAAHLRYSNIVSFGHQCSFLSAEVPRPEETERFGEFILKNYAPCPMNVGLHFEPYDDFIHTPVIRSAIRKLEPENKGHYTVYLPSYSDEKLLNVLGKIKDVRWEIFSKHTHTSYSQGNISISPVNAEGFNTSLTSCEGLLTGAGFESPAEALYLGKKLMVIPMKGQYEQQCNAAALAKMGVPALEKLDITTVKSIQDWVFNKIAVAVHYPDKTATLVENCFSKINSTDFNNLKLAY